MKTVMGMVLVATMTMVMYLLFLAPSQISGFIRYEGMRRNTKVILNVPVVGVTVNLPRFTGDVLVYSPLKLVKYVDLNVIDNWDSVRERRIFISSPIKSQYSFAFCYLRMLYEYEIDLPVRANMSDIKYDVTKYVQGKDWVFNLQTVDIESMTGRDFEFLMKAITTQAVRDTIKDDNLAENCIVEVSLGNQTRYLWGYYLTSNYLYVCDPVSPQLLYARVDLERKEYYVGLDVYKVRSYIRKKNIPTSNLGEN